MRKYRINEISVKYDKYLAVSCSILINRRTQHDTLKCIRLSAIANKCRWIEMSNVKPFFSSSSRLFFCRIYRNNRKREKKKCSSFPVNEEHSLSQRLDKVIRRMMRTNRQVEWHEFYCTNTNNTETRDLDDGHCLDARLCHSLQSP